MLMSERAKPFGPPNTSLAIAPISSSIEPDGSTEITTSRCLQVSLLAVPQVGFGLNGQLSSSSGTPSLSSSVSSSSGMPSPSKSPLQSGLGSVGHSSLSSGIPSPSSSLSSSSGIPSPSRSSPVPLPPSSPPQAASGR